MKSAPATSRRSPIGGEYYRIHKVRYTILSSIANSSLRVDCFRNHYRRARRVALGGRTILHGITDSSLRVDASITRYAGLLLGGHTMLHGITNHILRVLYLFIHRLNIFL